MSARSWPRTSSATPATSRRFPTAGHYARYNATAPIEASSGPTIAPPAQPRRQPPTQPRDPHRRRHPDPPRHPRTRLLPPQTRRGQQPQRSDPRPETTHQRRRLPPTPSPTPHADDDTGPGGQPGTTLTSSVAGRTLNTGTSEQSLPNPTHDATTTPRPPRAPPHAPPNQPLDTNRLRYGAVDQRSKVAPKNTASRSPPSLRTSSSISSTRIPATRCGRPHDHRRKLPDDPQPRRVSGAAEHVRRR